MIRLRKLFKWKRFLEEVCKFLFESLGVVIEVTIELIDIRGLFRIVCHDYFYFVISLI